MSDTNLPSVFNDDSFSAVLAEYGVVKSDVAIPPPPPVMQPLGWDELCTFKSPVVGSDGQPLKIDGHSGPLMFLEISSLHESDMFEESAGFRTITILHPLRGKLIVTEGVPLDKDTQMIKLSDVQKHCDTLSSGNLFQVAQFRTRAGYRVRKPIPVQESS